MHHTPSYPLHRFDGLERDIELMKNANVNGSFVDDRKLPAFHQSDTSPAPVGRQGVAGTAPPGEAA